MEIKLTFYDAKKNNEAWWNRLLDRVAAARNKSSYKWNVAGGSSYGSKDAVFTVRNEDGSDITEQNVMNEIIWCFIIDQLHIDSFKINNVDVTNYIKYR